MKKIIVLGGGYGGILTAKKLEKKLKKEEVQITLIDKNPFHTMLTELHEVAAGRVGDESIKMDFDKIFAHRNIEFVLDEIVSFDLDQKVIRSDENEYVFDYLVIGTGSKPNFFGVKGAEENAFQLWSYDHAIILRDHIEEQFRKAARTTNDEERQRMLTFVTVGAGFTGIEMAGELGEYKEELCDKFNLDSDLVRNYVVDMADRVLPILPEKLSDKTLKRLNKLGITTMTSTSCKEITSHSIDVGSDVIQTNTVIWAAGIQGSDLVMNADENLRMKNRIKANEYLQAEGYDSVFVVGDNIYYVPVGEECPVPQMVENAEHSAATVSKNITALIKGESLESYQPAFHGAMVCIGSRYGVAHVGLPNRMFSLSGFFAMFSKHFINLIYFIQVLGFHKIYAYLKHEVFSVGKRRSFTGGYFSNKTSVFWQVPLRVYLGVMWFVQGWDKAPKVIKHFNEVFLIPAPVVDGATGASAQETVEAVTEASPVVSDAVDRVVALPVPEFLKNIVDWSMELMFYNGAEFTLLAKLFQAGMVFSEIAIGLLLIGGLFTPVAAVWSVALGFMIYASGMAPLDMIFYVLSAIAVMFSGNAFGLDYYVWPWINKYLKKWKFTRKWYLYTE